MLITLSGRRLVSDPDIICEIAMAWFHFCTANHEPIGRSTLIDMANWFEAGLLDLGHEVSFSEQHLEPKAINVLWDCFTPRFARELAESNVTYGLVATEIPDGHAFNWRTEVSWKNRFDTFCDVAKGAAFIWAQIECTMPFYSQFCPTVFTALGFSERLVPNYINQQPERDFCFFGLRTPYREKAIAEIRKHASVEWPETLLSHEGVGQLIASSRVGLSFKQSEKWPVPSPPRLGRLMLAKRGVAAEAVPIPTQQGEIVGLCPADQDFAEYALDMLNSNWRERAERVFDDYRTQMPMSAIMEEAIEKTASNLKLKGKSEGKIYIRPETSPNLLGRLGEYNLLHYREKFVGLPNFIGEFDLMRNELTKVPLVFDRREHLERAINFLTIFDYCPPLHRAIYSILVGIRRLPA
jgi:hypothetical protein